MGNLSVKLFTIPAIHREVTVVQSLCYSQGAWHLVLMTKSIHNRCQKSLRIYQNAHFVNGFQGSSLGEQFLENLERNCPATERLVLVPRNSTRISETLAYLAKAVLISKDGFLVEIIKMFGCCGA